MTKKILKIFLLLALAVGFYAMTAKVKGGGVEAKPTQTAQATRPATSTPSVKTCEIQTGVDGGTVNLRTCAGTSCGVLDILTEGESLKVLRAGVWVNVTTEDGVTGWLNSKYCERRTHEKNTR